MANQLLYGFHQLADVATTLAIEVDRDLMIAAMDMSQEEHNRQVLTHLGLFAEPDTVYQLQFRANPTGESQELDENGRPRPIKGGAKYTCGFPIKTSGNALGANFITSQKMTVQAVNDVIGAMYVGDFKWMRKEILKALFANVDWVVTDPEYGDITVHGLANGDATLYVYTGSDVSATDNHYLAQAAAIADGSNPYPTIYDELVEHPENTGSTIVSFIPTGLKATTKALTNFYEVADANITPGSGVTTLTGTLGVTLPGNATVIGYCDQVWIAEWPALPANYILSLAVGGTQPLKFRQDPEANLQGFRPQGTIEDFPYKHDVWFRRGGFGGWNRTGACVTRIGNAVYAVPTGYGAP